MDKSRIEALVDSVLPEIIEIRHSLHKRPELACKEFETSKRIRERLKDTDLKLLEPFMETDVVGMLSGKNSGKNVTLRADIDALPLQEKTGVSYQSEIDGMMHACGHDGHTAMLIGAALVLTQLTEEFSGSIRFVFQPGEEVVAAGKELVDKGALLDPTPDMIFALHGFPTEKVGTIGGKSGCCMAAAEMFELTIKGKGAHGSTPDLSIDPILTGTKIVEGLQSIVSRMTPPLDPVVVSICSFNSGNNCNIIPDTAVLQGTTRYLNPEVGDKIPQLMEQVIKGVCNSTGADYEFDYKKAYIPTINAPEAVEIAGNVVRELLGDDNWTDIEETSMGGEDFAFYLKDYPGAMLRLGMGEDTPSLHSPQYDFNDDALKNGILFLVGSALKVLN